MELAITISESKNRYTKAQAKAEMLRALERAKNEIELGVINVSHPLHDSAGNKLGWIRIDLEDGLKSDGSKSMVNQSGRFQQQA